MLFCCRIPRVSWCSCVTQGEGRIYGLEFPVPSEPGGTTICGALLRVLWVLLHIMWDMSVERTGCRGELWKVPGPRDQLWKEQRPKSQLWKEPGPRAMLRKEPGCRAQPVQGTGRTTHSLRVWRQSVRTSIGTRGGRDTKVPGPRRVPGSLTGPWIRLCTDT